jgi:hypothetical protein
MRKTQGRFECWRKSQRGRLPIPDALWKAAAELAKEHDVFRTAKVLRLDYTKLKTLAGGTVSKRKASAPPRFVEFFPVTPGARECVIELDARLAKYEFTGKTSQLPRLPT